ncbi:TIGR03751 family conjugal transfer lipoprotein [Pseudomonas sp. 91RF]|jgi:conjugative transfer region lipoprotein (TIGR03751 family)|uniref:TIGR03751 family conjugal transfer lipoprotein n=1 Tax=Pseudomonas sp. 91RF TaxID=2292261 RepID=UPI000E66C23E|nr:TIGR03751 family conjugal transfer lipoprotein [Pseudomonas sp. 91RF]RIJ09673.1 TIGR03751 family conjugal transfer lipoprotein [Pseudomonas sp. 91RF]
MSLQNWIETLTLGLVAAAISGCATNTEDLLTHDGRTMMDVWNQQTSGSQDGQAGKQLMDARQVLRRPLTDPLIPSTAEPYTRTAKNEIQRQFHRLPNPDLVMYVFPHRAGTQAVPVPGYSTVFPLHQKVQYAMPGERLEDY